MIKLKQSFQYAIQGVRIAFREQQNLRIHFTMACLTIIMGLYFNISKEEWLAIVLSIGLVVVAELFNSSMESMVDMRSPEPHPLAGKTKDIAAGAVLIAGLIALIVGVIIFARPVMSLFEF